MPTTLLFALGSFACSGSETVIEKVEYQPATIDVATIAAGDELCGGAGGFRFTSGIDADKDGVLGEDEIVGTPQIVCNGGTGAGEQGPAGEAGASSSIVIDSSTPCADDSECALKCGDLGGVHVVLTVSSSDESIAPVQTALDLCNGQDGSTPEIEKADCQLLAAGATAQDALDALCEQDCGLVGGTKLWWAEDTEGAPLAESGTYICGDRLIVPTLNSRACAEGLTETATSIGSDGVDTECLNTCGSAGGLRIWVTYVDKNGATVRVAGASAYVCNGKTGLDGDGRTPSLRTVACTEAETTGLEPEIEAKRAACLNTCGSADGILFWGYYAENDTYASGSAAFVCNGSGTGSGSNVVVTECEDCCDGNGGYTITVDGNATELCTGASVELDGAQTSVISVSECPVSSESCCAGFGGQTITVTTTNLASGAQISTNTFNVCNGQAGSGSGAGSSAAIGTTACTDTCDGNCANGAGGLRVWTYEASNPNTITGGPFFVCNGAKGDQGEAGQTGATGTSPTMTYCNGTCNSGCASTGNGGIEILSPNPQYPASSNDQFIKYYLCNSKRTVSVASAPCTTAELSGGACAACASGGIKVFSYYTDDSTQTPIANTTNVLCNVVTEGSTPSVSSITECTTECPECANGGQHIQLTTGTAWNFCHGEDGVDGIDGQTPIIASERCQNTCNNACTATGSGVKIWAYYGTPTNVIANSTTYICDPRNGTDGQNGQDGADGSNGEDGLTPVIVSERCSGGCDGNCDDPNTGVKIWAHYSGSSTPIEGATSYICDPKDGAQGETGATGAQGPQGPQGNAGADGEDGADASCAGNTAPTITATLAAPANGQGYVINSTYALTVTITDPDDGQTISHAISGYGASIGARTNSTENGVTTIVYDVIPVVAGRDFNWIITVTDGCQMSMATFGMGEVIGYQGYSVVDPWGDTWDGTERKAVTWQVAKETCESLNGRLPTATELWRNSATYSFSDNQLGDTYTSNWLWTIIPDGYNNSWNGTNSSRNIFDAYISVRLSDGALYNHSKTNTLNYRCIWPNQPDRTSGFGESHCHGDPDGTRCKEFDLFYNIDTEDRAPLPWSAASYECAFYGAGIPTVEEYSRLIHDELPVSQGYWSTTATNPMSSLYKWTSTPYSTNTLVAINWTAANSAIWNYATSFLNIPAHRFYSGGTYTNNYNYSISFRCMGLKDKKELSISTPSCASGSCIDLAQRRSPIIADKINRGYGSQATATRACYDVDGTLATMGDAVDLIQQPINSSNWTDWTPGSYIQLLNQIHGAMTNNHSIQWLASTGAQASGNQHWQTYNSYSYASATSNTTYMNYRCVWHPKKPAWPENCQTPRIVVWDTENNSFVCKAGGDSAHTTYDAETFTVYPKDLWGNVWDGPVGTTAVTYDTAAATCQSRGGRLPTISEIWSLRPTPDYTSAASAASLFTSSTNVNYWSQTPSTTANNNYVFNPSTSALTRLAKTSTAYFRCIYENQRGDVLQGRNCYGPAGSECFTTDQGMTMDSADRPPVDVVAAAYDCKFSKGHLPSLAEIYELVYSWIDQRATLGNYPTLLPQGMLWSADSNAASYQELYRWLDGTTSAAFLRNTGTLFNRALTTSANRFRCVYSPYLK